MSNLMKVIITFFAVVVLFVVVGIYQAKTNFALAYDVLEEAVDMAETGQGASNLFLSEQAWGNWSNQSVYEEVRQPFPWEDFEETVQQCGGSLLYEKDASMPVVLQQSGQTHRSITIECVDEVSGKVVGSGVRVLLEKVDDDWKIIGRGK